MSVYLLIATELESCKSTQAVLTLKRDLEYEREKSHQLAQQLDRERASGRKTKSSADDVDIAHEATEDLNLPQGLRVKICIIECRVMSGVQDAE